MNKYVSPVLFSGVPGNAGAIGHQFRNWMTGYQIAHRYGIKFLHTPFSGDHTQKQIDVPVKEWEPFLSLGENELKTQDIDISRIIKLPKITWGQNHTTNKIISNIINRNYENQNVVFECADNQFLIVDWSLFKTNKIKDKYWANKKRFQQRENHWNNGSMRIAIHIRRGDVNQKTYPERYLSNCYYKEIIKKLNNIFGLKNLQINIYSQGEKEHFTELLDFDNIAFYLDTNIFDTFHNIVSSDIFVAGFSSFSILATYICNGLSLWKPWNVSWCNFPEDTNIIQVNNNNNFDIKYMEGKINEVTNGG